MDKFKWLWLVIIGVILMPSSVLVDIAYRKQIMNSVLDERETNKPVLWKDEVSGIIVEDTLKAPQSIVFFKHKWVKYQPK